MRLRTALIAAALVLLACRPAPLAAQSPQGNMAKDALDSFTRSPASRESVQTRKAAPAGPTAPAAPKAPTVAGAPAPEAQGRQRPLPAAAPRSPQRQGWLSLRHDGVERRAFILLPAQPLRKGQRRPTLLFLHGAAGSAQQAVRQTNLAARAAAAGYVAVFPEGLGPAGSADGQTWNAWSCCGYARDQRVDDVGFLAALIARLGQDFAVDTGRVFLAGFSNGAMLASRFALERPGAAAAIASVAGYLPCDAPRPATPLPVLIIHGDRDAIARFAPTPAHPATGRFCEDYPARAQTEFWVRGMGLGSTAKVRESARPPLRVEDYTPARKDSRGETRFVIVKGGGHAWPGGAAERYQYCDLPRQDVDATGMVLEFFRRHDPGATPEKAAPARKPTAKKAR